ncbi:MAG: hypothetical protein ACJZ8I_03835 [Paracoccaceae bacterium]
MVEKYGKFSDQFIGRSPYMNPVIINTKRNIIGNMEKVRIVSSSGLSLVGELIS